MKQIRIISYFLTLFVLLSCTPRSYYYWSSDSRLLRRENYVHEFLMPDYNFSITITVSAINYSGARRVRLTLTFSNGELDIARIDFRKIEVVIDGQVASLEKPYLHSTKRLIPDSIDYVFVVPNGSSELIVRTNHLNESGVPHLIELQMEDVVSINDQVLQIMKQPIRFELGR